ncbi:unnamed protein product [Linum tenue]|uniref:Nudix hydrolase domain-containing protein n=1 Tax=Linum tenue TaxID=586396 RepID=A0AAV0M7F1_9ROSI|nr:unnamed protein product [Linum tenue]
MLSIVPTLSFSNCPPKLHKFTKLPPFCTSLKLSTDPLELRSLSASSSLSSSMESPPEGYRRNVGICLINPSKKVWCFSSLVSHRELEAALESSFANPEIANCVDICRFKTGHTGFMADATAIIGFPNHNRRTCISLKVRLSSHCSMDWIGFCRAVLNNYLWQGGIDESEDPKAAALRELKEETGVSSAEILAEAPFWLTYDFPPQVREKLKQQWGTDCKGQAQKWFLLKFTGKEEEEINLLGDGSEKPEFGEWSWMSADKVIDRAVDFKKPVYKEVFSAFHPHLQ